MPVPQKQHQLVSFLLRASAATYAAHAPEDASPSRPASHDYHYRDGNYLYIDTYLGNHAFAGEEAVFENEQPIWAMNYCGRTLSDRFSGDFLKEALLLRPADAPFRGPKLHRRGAFTYVNRFSGDLHWFSGEEAIFCEGEQVFECRYHGGILVDAARIL